MKTKSIYCVILLVYALLWACQLIVCHMTHSLIILTDSYINLYKILDISLGILHLCTQRELAKSPALARNSAAAAGSERAGPTLAGRLFDCVCTYNFRRLPLLGSFMNGLFLAALLMSAAIEGIQTCVHSSHSQSALGESILHKDRLTYPLILAGFALVGLIMQHCSLKAHRMREEELQSESLLDVRHAKRGRLCERKQREGAPVMLSELSASNLNEFREHRPLGISSSSSASSLSSSSNKRRSYDLNLLPLAAARSAQAPYRPGGRNASLQQLPMWPVEREIPHNCESRISLKSLKLAANLDSIVERPFEGPIGTISRNLGAPAQPAASLGPGKEPWLVVRSLTSPLALCIYATINYFVADHLLTEISDAFLSICVVVLLFAASYPPMERAGRILLQSVPVGVDLARLEKELASSSPHILLVNNLHVWSLTPRSNRIATCELHLDKSRVGDAKQLELILSEARYKFLDQNIRCATIEPILKGRDEGGHQ